VPVISGRRCYTIVGDILIASQHAASLPLFLGLITFYLGILSLIIAVLTYVAMTASKPTKIIMSLVVAFTLLPTTYFIFFRPLFGQSKNATAVTVVEMDERSSLASGSTAPPMTEPHRHMSTPNAGYISVTLQPPAVGPMTPS